jgi:hypothetical protein
MATPAQQALLLLDCAFRLLERVEETHRRIVAYTEMSRIEAEREIVLWAAATSAGEERGGARRAGTGATPSTGESTTAFSGMVGAE